MKAYLYAIIFTLVGHIAFAQYEILLIGTSHQTPDDQIHSLESFQAAITKFKPDVICTEYRIKSDTASLRYLYGERHFEKQDSIRRAWSINASDMSSRIKTLERQLAGKNDLAKRMELRNLYFVTSDIGNAEFQFFQVAKMLEKDSSQISSLSQNFPMFRSAYNRYKRRLRNNDEYTRLVFPIALNLGIRYLFPIDDQSANVEYEKYFAVLNDRDTSTEDRKKYYGRIDSFINKFKSLPANSSLWEFNNSPDVINDLMYVEAYKIDSGNKDNDIKMLSKQYGLRNKTMAGHINTVAKANSGSKIVVFFGASHVGPIREELIKLSPAYSVLTYGDIKK